MFIQIGLLLEGDTSIGFPKVKSSSEMVAPFQKVNDIKKEYKKFHLLSYMNHFMVDQHLARLLTFYKNKRPKGNPVDFW